MSVTTQRSPGILPAVSAPGILPGGPNASQAGHPTKTTFAYDALHRRIARHESSTNTSTYFIFEGWSRAEGSEARQTNGDSRLGRQPRVRGRSARVNNTVVAEYKATPTIAKGATPLPPSSFTLHTSNVWGEDLSGTMQGAGGIGGLLASTLRTAPTTKNKAPSTPNVFYHYDSNGNIVLLTHALPVHANDAAKSKLPGKALIAAQYRYDAFGKTIQATGPLAQVNRYQFSTKPVEAESGLVYYGYRYLDTTHGRWISRDPIGELGGVNVYGMVDNQPLNNADTLGLMFEWVPVLGTIEQAIKTLWGSYPGMNAADYADAAKNSQSKEDCVLKIKAALLTYFIQHVVPNGVRVGIEYGITIVAAYLGVGVVAVPAGAVSAIDTLVTLGLVTWASDKMDKASEEAIGLYCEDVLACN